MMPNPPLPIASLPPIATAAGLLLLALFACAILDVGGSRKGLRVAALAGIALALAMALALPWIPRAAGPGIAHLLREDAFARLFAALSLTVALCVTLAAKERPGSYTCATLLTALGMVLAAAAGDLVVLYLSLELVTLSSYALVAYGRTRERMEAAVKYFVAGVLASALMLLGFGLLIVGSGTSAIAALTLAPGPVGLLALGAIVAGVGFKLGVFPFNLWMPDVYQASDGPVSGLLAGGGKNAGLAGLLRVMAAVALGVPQWRIAIAALAAVTMLVPTVTALVQRDARRIVAYSVVAHGGMALMGAALLTPLAVTGSLALACALALASCGAFIALGALASHGLASLDELRGAGLRNPLLGACLTLCLLSLAGIPLLAGFSGKLFLFYAIAQDGMPWLAGLAILASAVSLWYYFSIIRALYAERGSGKCYEVGHGTMAALLACAILTIVLGVYPEPLYRLATMAAGALF